jgi:hypothetical protein
VRGSMGKYFSIGSERGKSPSPPVQIRDRWFHASFPSNPY